jgi:hypothetical protein
MVYFIFSTKAPHRNFLKWQYLLSYLKKLRKAMNKISTFLLREFKEMINPLIYFLIVFNAIGFAKVLTLEGYSISISSTTAATIGALIMSKVILITNHLSISKVFEKKPRIYTILWKTFIYCLASLLLRSLEEILPSLSQTKSLSKSLEALLNDVSWPHFWAMQIWLSMSVIIYVSYVEIDKHFGHGSIKKALWFDKHKS